MQILRSARGAVRIGFWHIVLSLRTLLGPAERCRAIAAVVAEFGAMEHPRLVWSHADKPWARAGSAREHIHIVIGHVGLQLRPLRTVPPILRLGKVTHLWSGSSASPHARGDPGGRGTRRC
ncbi:hypothetical protein [Methylobacterium hispanicum]|uniref:hypothetical protein n=1 Tax=Methylobacterium hispanicum TaxID=270350 RepID=UPI003AF5AEDA